MMPMNLCRRERKRSRKKNSNVSVEILREWGVRQLMFEEDQTYVNRR